MTWRLSTQARDFAEQFDVFLHAKRDADAAVDAVVAQLIAQVRAEGDTALVELTRRFDQWDVTLETLVLGPNERAAAAEQVDAETRAALELAATRIRAYHQDQRPEDKVRPEPELGVTTGWRWRPMQAAGLYVPGGTAAYPSSLLMNAIPAKVAGVQRLTLMVPTPQGHLNPLLMLAAELAGVDEIVRVGGAQAIAALAYGTAQVAPVDVVVGPGNAYVAAAKRQVFGQVGIDMVAGPSEILIIADAGNSADWLAADLLSQAEHDPASQSILISDSADLLEQVEQAVEAQLQVLPRAEVARASWEAHGALILVRDLEEAVQLSDRIAPEHLEIATQDPLSLFEQVQNAGSVFLGAHTPEPLGDYLAGPNHVLPTGRSARFASGLGVQTFMKRTSFLSASPDGLRALAPAAMKLAEAEGLDAHARALSIRLN